MFFTQVTRENQELFQNLAPDYIYDDTDNEKRFALVILDGTPEDALAAGIVIYDIMECSNSVENIIVAEICWFYVVESLRRQGFGDKLLEEFLNTIDYANILHSICDLPLDPEYRLLRDFLEAWDYEFHMEEVFELSFKLGELANHRAFVRRDISPQIMQLKEISDVAFHNLIQRVKDFDDVRNDLPFEREKYEENVSCIYRDGDEIIAALLVTPSGGNHRLNLMFLRTFRPCPPSVKGQLAQAGFWYGKDGYSLDMTVDVHCTTTIAGDLIEKLLPEQKPPLVYRGYRYQLEEELT